VKPKHRKHDEIARASRTCEVGFALGAAGICIEQWIGLDSQQLVFACGEQRQMIGALDLRGDLEFGSVP
jgi:hypothetical protein